MTCYEIVFTRDVETRLGNLLCAAPQARECRKSIDGFLSPCFGEGDTDGVLLVPEVWILFTCNELFNLRNQVALALSTVDVQLKKRFPDKLVG